VLAVFNVFAALVSGCLLFTAHASRHGPITEERLRQVLLIVEGQPLEKTHNMLISSLRGTDGLIRVWIGIANQFAVISLTISIVNLILLVWCLIKISNRYNSV